MTEKELQEAIEVSKYILDGMEYPKGDDPIEAPSYDQVKLLCSALVHQTERVKELEKEIDYMKIIHTCEHGVQQYDNECDKCMKEADAYNALVNTLQSRLAEAERKLALGCSACNLRETNRLMGHSNQHPQAMNGVEL